METKLTKLSLLFILLCSLPVFHSCSDDETDKFFVFEYWEVLTETPVNNVNISILTGTKLGIIGGTMPFTVEIDDKQIATASLDESNDIHISPVKLGTTSLMVKDADGRRIKIGVQVVNARQSFAVQDVKGRITGIDDSGLTDQQKETIKKLEEEVMDKIQEESSIIVQPTGRITFSFDTKEAGTVKIITSATETASPKQGTFVRLLSESGYSFQVTIDNGKTYNLKLQSPERPDTSKEKKTTTRDIGPVPFWMIEDMTEHYKTFVEEQLEAENINAGSLLKIECIYIGTLAH
ncbi:pilus assembly protein N-terminal domain-containing protein [Bacteroides sp.]|uniref:pilus assembly protein N-terminal domain-containing protein n=1 Tax=Bacteroides sp. TaxID=29523 RepID=UPI0011DCE0E3|nr:pilus assembly protein N-terminal domain-containing protein [Bacteroides sp.]